ncbi:MAG: hypothetical protein A3K76_06475 [Euryarchaeota archaeon RBG_13_57_23]|nr:MAG: hypothetical protein A3K76_06475 [Euryarchaeota archaeon RBG_13_57_23]
MLLYAGIAFKAFCDTCVDRETWPDTLESSNTETFLTSIFERRNPGGKRGPRNDAFQEEHGSIVRAQTFLEQAEDLARDERQEAD